MKIRTKRHICAGISAASFFMIYGTVGGIERNATDFKTGMIVILVSFIVGVAAAYKGGYLT
jgi:hypothetical protein